jgi:hypothetical protein
MGNVVSLTSSSLIYTHSNHHSPALNCVLQPLRAIGNISLFHCHFGTRKSYPEQWPRCRQLFSLQLARPSMKPIGSVAALFRAARVSRSSAEFELLGPLVQDPFLTFLSPLGLSLLFPIWDSSFISLAQQHSSTAAYHNLWSSVKTSGFELSVQSYLHIPLLSSVMQEGMASIAKCGNNREDFGHSRLPFKLISHPGCGLPDGYIRTTTCHHDCVLFSPVDSIGLHSDHSSFHPISQP